MNIIGIDVSKNKLDCALINDSNHAKFKFKVVSNSEDGFIAAYVPLRHYHRKLGAGFVTLPQMTGRRFGMPFILSPPALALRFRQNNGPTPSGDYQPSRSLSMAGAKVYAARI